MRVSCDPHEAATTVRQLGLVNESLRDAERRIAQVRVLLPPHVASRLMMSAIELRKRGNASADAVVQEQAGIARRALAFVSADGGADGLSPEDAAALIGAVIAGATGGGSAGGKPGGPKQRGLFPSPEEVIRGGFNALGWAGAGNDVAKFFAFLDPKQPLTWASHNAKWLEQVTGKAGDKILKGAGLLDAYDAAIKSFNGTTTQTDIGKLLAAGAAGGAAFVFSVATGPAGLVDSLSGGHVQRQVSTGMESVVVLYEGLLTQNGAAIEKLGDEITSGERGLVAEYLIGKPGDFLGGVIYDSGAYEIMSGAHDAYIDVAYDAYVATSDFVGDAGEAIGDSVGAAADGAKDAWNNRPGWLGGNG